MSAVSIQDKICHYIASKLPEDILRDVHEGIVIEFGFIEDYLQRISSRLKSRLRPQMQRYSTDTVMEAQKDRATVHVYQTTPKGESYVVLEQPGLTVSHIELKEGDVPRPAAHRDKMAGKNSFLQPDLFRSADDIDSLHIALVVVPPLPGEPVQSAPKNILISVPYSDFRSFHLQISIEQFYEFYEMRKADNPPMVDAAWPALKEDILQVESQDKTSSSE